MASSPKRNIRSKKTSKKRVAKSSKKRSLWFSIFSFCFKLGLVLFVVVSIVLGYYMWQLDKVVRAQFEGEKWSLPTHVYSRPTELFAGANISEKQLIGQLSSLGYSEQNDLGRAGNYQVVKRNDGRYIAIHLRKISTPNIEQTPGVAYVGINNNRINRITDEKNSTINKIFLEPQLIGTLGKNREEDRKIIRIEDVPKTFITTLLITEDQDFNDHHGVSISGIARAMIANIKQGRMAQGGSTITQQLVKNFYLSSERKLKRKVKEALMAILLEIHYSKAEILETYINEVYLGQAGNRAIHGFNLASYFYFNRPMSELTLDQHAMLVGLVKGPSLYNPVNRPENAIKRRNVVIGLLRDRDLITDEVEALLIAQPLKISQSNGLRTNDPYPAFMDYVIQNVTDNLATPDQPETEVLAKLQGMEIYSTLDIYTQSAAEEALKETLDSLEEFKGLSKDSLQGSIIVSKIDSGEIIALTSDKNARYSGFNRALNASRQIGSLLKPIIYLTAIDSRRYSLASMLQDEPVNISLDTGQTWSPNNYDRKYKGNMLLIDALAESRNAPLVKLGMNVGLNNIINNARAMGLSSNIPAYPSVLLGSSEHTPYEVTQMYQTLANGGHRSDLYGASYIRDADKVVRWQNDPKQTRVISEDSSFLVNYAMQEVVNSGTARSLRNTFGSSKIIAGKTGTTNDLKDSWFVGYTGNILAVVWVGRDDSKTTRLTGASGALKVWQNLFERLGTSSWPAPTPPRVNYLSINKLSGAMAESNCPDLVNLPFASGTEPAFESCRARPSFLPDILPEVQEVEVVAPVETPQPEAEDANISDWLKSIFSDEKKDNAQ